MLVEAVLAGALVEFGNQLAGGGEHDRIEALVGVGTPRGEGVVGHGGQVTDVDALVVEVEAERRRVAVAQREGGGGDRRSNQWDGGSASAGRNSREAGGKERPAGQPAEAGGPGRRRVGGGSAGAGKKDTPERHSGVSTDKPSSTQYL